MTQKDIITVLKEMRSLCNEQSCYGCPIRNFCWFSPGDLSAKDITDTARELKKWSERK